MPTPKSPFEAEVNAPSGAGFSLPRDAVEARRRRGLVGAGGYDEAADKWGPRPPCAALGSEGTVRRGRTGAGHRFRERLDCGRKLASPSGTILEPARRALWRWVLFVRLTCLDVRPGACAELRGISRQTAWERRHGAMAAMDGHRDRVVPGDEARVDETYATDSDLKGGPGRRPRRGPGKNETCVAVATDARKSVAAARRGHGRPPARRIREAPQGHVAEGPETFHDMEKSHKPLVRAVKGPDRPYRADTKDPEHVGHVATANNPCPWMRRCLRGCVGTDLKCLRSYLNWHACLFRVKQAEERWPKVERVLRHLFMANATFRSSRKREHAYVG